MLGNHEKDKNTLITTKAKLKVVNKELEEMRWSHEVLQQKYNQVSVAKITFHRSILPREFLVKHSMYWKTET